MRKLSKLAVASLTMAPLLILPQVVAGEADPGAGASCVVSQPFALLARARTCETKTFASFLSRYKTAKESDRLPTFTSDPNIGMVIVIK